MTPEYAIRAAVVAKKLRADGWTVEERHYPSASWDELDRYYVMVHVGDRSMDTQFHQRCPYGTGANTVPETAEEIAANTAIDVALGREPRKWRLRG